jgi:hypothetical protein
MAACPAPGLARRLSGIQILGPYLIDAASLTTEEWTLFNESA